MAFCKHAPLHVWKARSPDSAGNLCSSGGKKSFPFFGGCVLKGFAGLFYWELSLIWIPVRPSKALPFPSAARPHAARFSTSLLHFAEISLCLSPLCSASLVISPSVCSCSLLPPSHFSRWSLVWFRCPDAFTQWCFGCSRGKQVSVLCFYFFPD